MTNNILSFFIKPVLGFFDSIKSILIGLAVFIVLGLILHQFPTLLPDSIRQIALGFDVMMIGGLWAKAGALMPQLAEYENIFNQITSLLNTGTRDILGSDTQIKHKKIRELIESRKK